MNRCFKACYQSKSCYDYLTLENSEKDIEEGDSGGRIEDHHKSNTMKFVKSWVLFLDRTKERERN